MNSNRVSIYVDGQHLYHAAKSAGIRFGLPSARPDYDAITTRALREAGDQLGVDWRTLEVSNQRIYFTSKNRTIGFEKTLERFGYSVKSHIMRSSSDAFDWDVEIACDVLVDVLAPQTSQVVDLVVLVTGDGDFAPLTEQLRRLGTDSLILGFAGSTSSRFEVTTRWLGQEEIYAG